MRCTLLSPVSRPADDELSVKSDCDMLVEVDEAVVGGLSIQRTMYHSTERYYVTSARACSKVDDQSQRVIPDLAYGVLTSASGDGR